MSYRNYYIGFIFSFLLLGNIYGQEFTKPLVPEKTERFYRYLLRENEKVVAFIESSLVANGIPKLMRNLALIESNFDKNAVSSAQAVGIWQFTEDHAKQYGLPPEGRYDVYKSTLVAVQSLRNLYAKYQNWITVVAAYNCGEGCVDRAIGKSQSKKYSAFYSYLPNETTEHVQKFLIACIITDEYEALMMDYKSTDMDVRPTEKSSLAQNPSFVATEISSSFKLEIVAQEIGVTISDLLEWNPSLKKECTEKGIGNLYLPVDKMPDFLLLKNQILLKSLEN